MNKTKKLAPTGCKCKLKVKNDRQAGEGIEPALFTVKHTAKGSAGGSQRQCCPAAVLPVKRHCLRIGSALRCFAVLTGVGECGIVHDR